MAFKEITALKLNKTKAGWTWDRKRELWFTWQVDTVFKGARHIRRGFVSQKEAKNYLDQLEIQEKLIEIGAVSSIVKFPQLAELFEKHLATKEETKGKVKAARIFNDFLSKLPDKIKLNDLKRKHFKDYADRRIETGVKPETARREITEISAAIHKASDYYAELEGWTPPRIYRPEAADDARNRIVTRHERDRLINYLIRDKGSDEQTVNYIARVRAGLLLYFGFLTGLRHGEIAALEKINYDSDARRLKAERFKTKKHGVAVTIFEPLNDSQVEVLERAANLYPEGEYFFSEKGVPHNRTYSILKAAAAHLKIPYGRKTSGGFIIHDARHTFVTTLEHGSVDSSTTRSFSGHSKDAMMKRYAHATFDSRARAMEIIQEKIGSGDAGKNAKLLSVYEDVRRKKINFEEFRQRLEKVLV